MTHNEIEIFYNDIHQKFGDSYEASRWFRTPITTSHFEMTTKAISDTLSGLTFDSCFELGPGAGTWTKLLLTLAPQARYDLLDISETMLAMAKDALAGQKNISFTVNDFLTYTSTRTYALFFSSRAVEYIIDKEAAVKKIYSMLEKDGHAVITTKNPRYWAYRLFGKTIPQMHRNQISPREFSQLLRTAGFTVISVRPVTVTVPFFKSYRLNNLAFALLRHSWVSWIHPIFTESYIVHAKKHGT